MKRIWKKAVALILAVVMTLQLVPSSAYAATGSGTGSGYNEQVMAMLEDICDTEEDAQRYYAMLEEYGFMDSDGNAIDSWSITMDGEQVTLDEIRELLDEPGCDKSRYVVVDGTPVTLENLETMIEIEDYIAYLEETYYTPQAWSEEALANLDDLVNQINSEGIEIVDDSDEASWEPAVNHDVRLKVEASKTENVSEKSQITFTVTPTEEQTKDITFTWRTVNGSAKAEMDYGIDTIVLPGEEDDDESVGKELSIDDVREMFDSENYDPDLVLLVDNEEMTLGELGDILDGKITIPAYSTDSVVLTVYVGKVQGRVDGSGTFLVQIYDVTNALFDDGTARWEQTVSVQSSEEFHYQVNMTQTAAAQDWSNIYSDTGGTYRFSSVFFENYYDKKWYWSNTLNMMNTLDYNLLSYLGLSYNSDTLGADTILLKYFDASDVTFSLEGVEIEGNTFGGTVSVGDMTLTRGDFPYGATPLPGAGGLSGGKEGFWNLAEEWPTHTDEGNVVYGSVLIKAENENGQEMGQMTGDIGKNVFAGYSNTTTQVTFDSFDLTNSLTSSGSCTVTVCMPDLFYVAFIQASDDFWHQFAFFPLSSEVNITLSLWETTTTAKATLSVADGTYYAGQSIPITVTFDYPMEISGDMFLNINGQKLSPVEVGSTAETCTFLYEVQDADTTTLYLSGDEYGETNTKYNLNGLGANGREVTVTLSTSEFKEGQISENVRIDTPDKSAAITGITAEITSAITDPVLNVKVDILDDSEIDGVLTQWLVNELANNSDQESGLCTSESLSVCYYDHGEYVKVPLTIGLEDTVTGGALTVEIPIDLNTTEAVITHGVELMIDDEVSMEFYATTTQAPAMFLTEDDIDAQITVTQADGETEYTYTDESYSIWLQDQAEISASVAVNAETEWSFADTEATTIYQSDGSPADPDADFVWWIGDKEKNTDNTIANIDAEGRITATGTVGTAYVYLTALNGDNKVSDEGGRAVTVQAYRVVTLTDDESITDKLYALTFDVGLTPFLYIPYDTLSSVSGQDVTIYWTSNLCDKNNEEIGDGEDEPETVFNVSLICEGTGEEIFSVPVTGTASNPASGYTIDGDLLTYDYKVSENNIYTFTVSSVYEGVMYTATAVITVQPSPAVVTLGSLDSYYVADDIGSIPITWTIESFSYFEGSGSGQFDLQITTDNGDFVFASSDPAMNGGSMDGTYRGSYTLNIDDVTATSDDPTSYRKIYTVTVAAKNGSDSTWSYDSFLLYVYDRDALDIWVNGEKSGDDVSLSNVKAISEMSQDQIIALNRDINLKAMVSVNYGEYAWTELTDQMAWASTDSSVAPVTYQQGSLYENIEHFSYTSYRPTTEFGITGRADGTVTISAEHVLTGISDDITLSVERLDDQLYLFQCYPQTVTELTYTNGNGETKTVESDADGAAAIYEENGIVSDVYFQSEYEGYTYLGTFYNENLKSGEGDWTLLERYPCNNLTLRKAAYAYLYLKDPEGNPYTDDIIVRGGVYLNGEYVETARFDYNGEQGGIATQSGSEDYRINLGESGKLEITMDQVQWGTDTGAVNAWDEVSYVFEICMADDGTELYPMIITIDGSISEAAYVGTGEAVVSFRENTSEGKHPFIVGQMAYHGGVMESVLDGSGSIGPSASYPTAQLYTMGMWWGEDDVTENASLQLFTEDGRAISTENGAFEFTQTDYPFSDNRITTYSVRFDADTLSGILDDDGESCGLYLEYYKDGSALTRREDLTFSLTNMIGVEEVAESADLLTEIQDLGLSMDAEANDPDNLGGVDNFFKVALDFASGENYTTGDKNIFSMQLAPTSDPTKFLGFIEVNIGGLNIDDADDDDDSQINYAMSVSEDDDWSYWPGMDELMVMAGKKTQTDYFNDAKENVSKGQNGKTVSGYDLSYSLGGYMESLLYYDYDAGNWKMKVLSGGFNVGGGYEYAWNFNTMVGPVPFTATLKIGAEAEVKLDALTAAYTMADGTSDMGSDILTELRLYLYVYFFAGVGFDYAVVAFKLGVYGQIDADMQFDWLKRNYLNEDGATPVTNNNTDSSLSGQHYAVGGEVGLELVIQILFVSYDKILFSYNFNILDTSQHEWVSLQDVWKKDKGAYDSMISSMLSTNSLSVVNVGGVQTLSLNLAATKTDVSYLESGSTWNGGISTYSLDPESGLKNLNDNAYEFAEPLVTDDGKIVAFLGVPGSYSGNDGEIITDNVAAMYATGSGGTYSNPQVIPEPTIVLSASNDDEESEEPEESEESEESEEPEEEEEGEPEGPEDFEEPEEPETGSDDEEPEDDAAQLRVHKDEKPEAGDYGDSDLSLAGTGDFAVAAWTQQTVEIAKDGDGEVLTDEDQRMMLEGTDICVSVYNGSEWTTARIENAGADMAPMVATNGKGNAIVAWRSVAVSDGNENITDFDQKDEILYKIYSNGEWSGETYTLYNGTSGNVKGLTAGMLSDGTAAVAYALDTDRNSESYTDREIVYAVIDTTSRDENGELTGEVKRNVRATNDAFLDENPQLTTITINGNERFLLGWYTEQSGVEGIDGSKDTSGDSVTSDIRLIDFDADGTATQLMPDSISSAATGADVSITSDFAFTKSTGETDINKLSIVWTERTLSDAEIEHDVIKAVKFYTYGENNEMVSFTGAAELAEMPEGTLVDSFDAYTTDGTTVKAVIMGTTYGKDGVVEKTGVTEGGDEVMYEVPSSVTDLYTATEAYTNTINVPEFLPDYEMLKLGAKTEIMFNVENRGIKPVTSLTVTVGDGSNENNITTFTGLNLLAGDSMQVYADYQVPGDAVRDEEFTVTATFSDGSVYTYGAEGHEDEENLIYMNLPDIQITDASIVREEDGERDILIKLNNKSDAALGENSNSYVRLGFYTDATYENEFTDEFSEDSYGLKEIIIDDPVELKMIDEGGYSTKVTFNVKDYLTDAYGELTEIPETGVNVYIKAEVIDAEGVVDEETGEVTYEVMNEPNTVNNCEMVTCENLQIRTGQDVTITSTLDISEDGSVRVKVDLQNTRLTTTETGNVIVTLLGEDGSILAQKQSYNGTSGLITLEGEAKDTEAFTFKGITDAFTVSVIYTDMILDGDDISEGLDTLLFPSLEENVTLDDFKWDEDAQAYLYSITVKDLTWVSMIAVARDAGAAITVNGETTDFYTVAMNLDLTPGETNVITIDVKNRNGIVTSYIFTIYDETDEVPAAELTGETGDSGAAGTGGSVTGGSAAGSGTSSDTGDSGRPLMLFIIMIACAVVIVGMIVSGRRKRLAGEKE